MAVLSYIEAITAALRTEMERDPNVFLLGEDIGQLGGVFRVTAGLQAQFGADRVLDTPLSEAAIVGVGIGAAAYGLRPVAEVQFADFIYPACNQIISEASKLRYRSHNSFTCPLVIRAPYGGGVHGGLYHSQCVEASFTHVPGLTIVMPSTPTDAKGLLQAAIRSEDPVLFFEHKKMYRWPSLREKVPEGGRLPELGKARVRREGTDVTVIAYGMAVHWAMEAARLLTDEGFSVHILDLCTLVPLDREAIYRAVARTGRVLIVHEDNRTGGFGGEVAACIAENAFWVLDAPIRRVAAPDVPAVPYSDVLEQAFLPNAKTVAYALRSLIQE
ncbi:alpha-ketoacid dehydrogenase subunit beta [Pasteuria penetrans]|uniref:alpha-ketoacid dehydrogenase subunit beta n=1 Tax=Pasteuria penetrans TaxID=86005 RepID=UPI000FB0B3B0|nr:alpha-ketoacid dehydrogenase subunit beta [Pasteuria penetrans]